jgi:hypothetical protein
MCVFAAEEEHDRLDYIEQLQALGTPEALAIAQELQHK